MLTKTLASILVFAIAASAQTQIATVMSDSPFTLRGANVNPGQGVPSWPAMAGDMIQAGQTPVTITYQDGSTIIVAPQSSGKIDMAGPTPGFQLQSGVAHYSLKNLSSLKLNEGSSPVIPKLLTGELRIGASRLPAGWWTAPHVVAVLAASGGAAALGIGLARRTTDEASPIVPPTQ